MKKFNKIVCVLLVALMLVVPFVGVDAKTKTTKKVTTTTTTTESTFYKSSDEKAINVYVFYSNECPHCADLHTYLAELKEDKDIRDKFNIVDYEIHNSENNSLMMEVGEYFNTSVTGVPFYVIGNKYYSGFGDPSKTTIVNAINDNYNSKKYQDYVAAIVNGTTSDLVDEKANNIIGMVILGICVVIIIALIVCSSKNKYYDDEDDEEEVEEEKKPVKEEKKATKKAEATKTTKTAKKTTTTKKSTKAKK